MARCSLLYGAVYLKHSFPVELGFCSVEVEGVGLELEDAISAFFFPFGLLLVI